MTQQEWIEKLTAEGYKNVTTHEFPGNMDFGSHTHEEPSIHVILKGELTLTDETSSTTIVEGERFDIASSTTHSAKSGPDGLTMIVGHK